MPRFFVDPPQNDRVTVTGADAHHISRVLRMRVGEELTVTIPVSEENAQALSDGDAALYHIDGDGTAEAVEEFEVVINGENSSVTFTSNTFSSIRIKYPFFIGKS